MKQPTIKHICSAGLMTFCAMPLTGQAAEESKALDDIFVTASGFEESAKKAPASISIVTREDLANKPYRDVRDALAQVPGVSLNGGPTGDISIRGMEGDGTLILVDGKRVNSTRVLNQKGGNIVEYSWMPPVNAIERIEIVKGPMSSLYGTDAMGGVINIITTPSRREWTATTGASATVQENSISGNITHQNFYLSGPLSDKLGIKLYGAARQRQEDTIPNGFQENRNYTLSTDIDYELTDRQFLTLSGSIGEDKYHGRSEKSFTGDTESIRDYKRYSLNVTHEYFMDWGNLTTTLAYDKAKLSSPTRTSFLPSMNNSSLNTKLVIPMDSHTLTWGIAVKREAQEIGGMVLSADEKGRVAGSAIHKAIFAEDTWQITNSLSTTLGARYNHHSNYGGHLSPRLYMVWQTSDSWTIKGGISSGYRSPDLKEVNPAFGTPQSKGSTTWGNPNLKPETSVNTELSFNYDGGKGIRGSLTLFDTQYKDKITNTGSKALDINNDGEFGDDGLGDRGPDGKPQSVYFNMGEATIRGIELAAQWDISKTLTSKASYTYTDSEISTHGKDVYGFSLAGIDGGALVNTPRHLADLSLDWQISEQLSSYVSGVYRGKELQAISLGQIPSLGNDTMKDSFQMNVGMGWEVSDDILLSAAVYNLTDNVRYDASDSETEQYIEDGRRYWLSVQWTI